MTRDEIFKMARDLSNVDIYGLPNSLKELKSYTNAVIEITMEDERPVTLPFGWLHEDELPEDYPYDEMHQYSQIRWGTRIFPLFNLPQPAPARVPLTDEKIDQMFKDAEVSIWFAERERRRALEIYSFGVRDAEAAHGIVDKE